MNKKRGSLKFVNKQQRKKGNENEMMIWSYDLLKFWNNPEIIIN